jgi:hypothetical protein
MKKNIKPFLYISIPLVSALIVGIYEVYFQSKELEGGNEYDASQWAFSRALFYIAGGFGIGLIIDLLLWLIIPSKSKVIE